MGGGRSSASGARTISRALSRPVLSRFGGGSSSVSPTITWSVDENAYVPTATTTSPDLFVGFNNAWWAAGTSALFVDIDGVGPTLNLYDVGGATTALGRVSGGLARAATATDASGRVLVVRVTPGDEVVVQDSDDAFATETVVSDATHTGCTEVGVVFTPTGAIAFWTADQGVFFAWYTNLYGGSAAAAWWPAQAIDDGGASGTQSFPSVAVSGDGDLNLEGPVVLFVWRGDSGGGVANIYARATTEYLLRKGTLSVEGGVGIPSVWGDPDQSTGVVALTSSGTGEDSRDPCVWCTPEGRFWVGYSYQASIRSGALAYVLDCSAPAHGGTWSGPASMDTTNVRLTQNFVNGHCDTTAGYAIAVWEYGNSNRDGGKQAWGAWLDLNDASATWQPFNESLSAEPETEIATLPTVWVNPDGTFLLAYIWESATPAFAVRVRIGTPT